MNKLGTFLIALSVILAAGCSTTGTHIGRVAPRVVEKKSVHAYRLANGFTVLVRNGETTGTTAVQVWTEDGSSHDPEGKEGLSHFVEHLLFESPGRDASNSINMLEGMGGELNGNTGKDYSYVGVTLPGTGWQKAVGLLYKMTTTPDFSPKRVEDQRKVVELELEYRSSDPERVLMDNLMKEAYKAHPYGNPVVGTMDSLKGLTAADAADYHQKVYVPSRMTLAVAGDVSPEEVKEVAEKTFGTMQAGKGYKYVPAELLAQVASRQNKVSMAVNLTYVAMGWHVCPTTDKDIFPLEVLRTVLGVGTGSRLNMELKVKRPLVLDAQANLFAYRESGMFVITTKLDDAGEVPKIREELLYQAEKLKTELISKQELERAVNTIDTQQMAAADKAEGQAYALGYWATVYAGQSPGEYMDKIREVTPDDVRRVALKYLGEGNYNLSVIIPQTSNQ